MAELYMTSEPFAVPVTGLGEGLNGSSGDLL